MVCKMYEDGFSLEQISEYCSLNVDEIQVLINHKFSVAFKKMFVYNKAILCRGNEKKK